MTLPRTTPQLELDQLTQLPLRALLALAARTARRVEGHTRAGDRDAVAGAIRLAERFARGEPVTESEAVAAAMRAGHCSSHAHAEAHRLADAEAHSSHAFRASAAANAAAHAAKAAAGATAGPGAVHGNAVASAILATVRIAAFVDRRVHGAALDDYRRLLDLSPGRFPDPGDALDAGDHGPIGPIAIPHTSSGREHRDPSHRAAFAPGSGHPAPIAALGPLGLADA